MLGISKEANVNYNWLQHTNLDIDKMLEELDGELKTQE